MEQSSHQIIRCASCGTKNRIPTDRANADARCGKCAAPLQADENRGHSADSYTLRCEKCRTKNRVPAGRIDADPKCGRCATILPTGELF